MLCLVTTGDSWAQLLQKEGIIAKFCPIDFSDAEHAFDNCLKVRQWFECLLDLLRPLRHPTGHLKCSDVGCHTCLKK